jgi:hypothetical protein
MSAMKFLKYLSPFLLIFILTACGEKVSARIEDFIFSKDDFECAGTVSDQLIKADGKITPGNTTPTQITAQLDKSKGKLTLEGSAPIQSIGTYFLVCSMNGDVIQINGTTCESDADVMQRMENYGRKPADIQNWIDHMHDNTVKGEFNRLNKELKLLASTKNDASTTEIRGAFKCTSKS